MADWLTRSEAAEILGKHRNTLLDWEKRDCLLHPYYDVRGARLYDRAEVEALRDQKREPLKESPLAARFARYDAERAEEQARGEAERSAKAKAWEDEVDAWDRVPPAERRLLRLFAKSPEDRLLAIKLDEALRRRRR